MKRTVCTCMAIALGGVLAVSSLAAQQKPTAYVRYIHTGHPDVTSYGILEGDTIQELKGDLFANPAPTGRRVKRAEVQLLAPCDPKKVIAVGLNYKSHLGDRKPSAYPGLFAKYPSSIVGHEANIVIPPDSTNIHYEGELVVVIGKRAKNISKADAPSHIFGVTAGNDVSERQWQNGATKDLQWWRAKGSDTFAPLGPAIVSGVDYGKLLLQTRMNGETIQQQYTSDLIFNIAAVLSWISGWVTLNAGDLIYTGTPGNTRKMSPGDVMEVELEHAGVLRNPVA